MLALLAAVGCGVRFRPATPMRAQAADIALDLTSIRVGLSPEIVFTVRSDVPHAIDHGY